MVVEQTTIVPLDSWLAKRIQVGDEIKMQLTIKHTYPAQTVLKVFRVMTVDRINELVECREVRY